MKTLWVTAGLLIGGWGLSLQAIAQSGQNAEKARQEIEVMKSILNTTLTRSAESQDRSVGFGSGSWSVGFGSGSRSVGSVGTIQGFYLPGQGTTFLLQAPRIPEDFNFHLDELEKQIQELTAREFANPQFAESMARLAAANVRAVRNRLGSEVVPEGWWEEFEEFRFHFPPAPPSPSTPPSAPAAPSAPAPPSPPAVPSAPLPESPPQPPTPPAPEPMTGPERAERMENELREQSERLRLSLDRVRLSLEEVRARAGERKANAEQRRQELIDTLLEVAAQYGGTLTHLDENEHLNFVLLSGDRFLHPLSPGVKSEPEVISLKKSDITEVRRLGLGASGLRDRMVRQ